MESIEETTKSAKSSNEGFINHVFKFDEDSKHEMMNIVQYSLLAIIPIVLLNKSIQRFVPEVEEGKGTPEILAEVVFQVITMFLGILIIHRIISFVPTYSQEPYAKFHVTNIILAFLVIVLSLQTKLGEKVNILIERLQNIIYGETTLKEEKKGNTKVKVTQPLSNLAHQPSRADHRDSENPQYPSTLGDMANQQAVQTAPNFNSMYAGPNTPLVNASVPNQEQFAEPMAANSFGGFGTAF